MTPDQAAWVRENVWPTSWLSAYQEIPGTFEHCACQQPPSLPCQAGAHSRCDHDAHPVRETVVQTSTRRAAQFPEPHQHRPPAGHNGRRDAYNHTGLAWVWLAGHPCRELCTCDCHRPDAEPAPASAPDQSLVLVGGEQLDLFGAAT
ncbi:hypothetical protein U9R90_25065 [Streptomyces sp. E11-3]|uniref:hypothetical protein n=1 Tax=Streptomyces sp. E11-3 TaxID=3110112 RepID=UPI0039805B89